MTRYGNDVLLKYFAAVLVILLCAIWLVDALALKLAVVAVVALCTGLVVNFFRDPERVTPSGDEKVISPADGKIVVIAETDEPRFVGGKAVQISIFMSPLDVHVNRIPVAGTVRHVGHVPGKFVVAYADKASELNERMEIAIERPGGGMLFMKQIAGTVARRIVAELKPGQEVAAGERFGMIKFGSRVDVVLPAAVAVRVALNDRVAAGETVLATYPPNA